MKKHLTFALIAGLAAMPVALEAQGNGNGNGRGNNPLNCPPGLAKKDPACVPPGLARQGVSTQQYLDLSDQEWEQATAENPDLLEGNDVIVTDEDFVVGPLTEKEIIDLFDLDAPDDGQTYALIDGQVVELGTEDKIIFDQVKVLSQTVEPSNDREVVPDVGLTESQLIAIYDLPPAPDGQTYTVVDGQIYSVQSETYALLQLIKAAAAI